MHLAQNPSKLRYNRSETFGVFYERKRERERERERERVEREREREKRREKSHIV